MLQVGNEERIHVYYAHGQDKPNFVRRCYWLLDKTLEHIVLVHYRETQETTQLQGSPATPGNSHSSSSQSERSAPCPLPEESDSSNHAHFAGDSEHVEIVNVEQSDARNLEKRLYEINTLDWDDLLVTNHSNGSTAQGDKVLFFEPQNQLEMIGTRSDGSALSVSSFSEVVNFQAAEAHISSSVGRKDFDVAKDDFLDVAGKDGLQTQDSFGRWMNYIISDSPGSVDGSLLENPIPSNQPSFVPPLMDHHQSSVTEPIFSITDVSPAWAFSTEKTKIILIGFFHDKHSPIAKFNLVCVCDDVCVPAEIIQFGVFRCSIPPHTPGVVSLFLSADGHKPISQVLMFEYRASLSNPKVTLEDNSTWEEFRIQIRLAQLLFSSSKSLNLLSSKVSQNSLKEAKNLALKVSHISKGWEYLVKSIENNVISYVDAKDKLFELALKEKMHEWLSERVVEGCKITNRDEQGQGVIHLCAILGYTWAVYPFSWSGLSLDYRDKCGWTALHWAAYCGREKMVAVLLSAGAKSNLVTDPTPENPGGRTAADLASMKGYDGLAAYLAEKALVEQFKDMTIAGNISGSLQSTISEPVYPVTLSEEEISLKDTLTAYRTAAVAAASIQAAYREQSLKLQSEAIRFANPEIEARNIIAAMKIQHAFRNYDTKKKMTAAARIQHRFRTWKIRRDFLNMRHQAIRIQAVFRAYQVRRQYRKILWSVGVLDKAILRWRLKRKGFRGLQVEPVEAVAEQKQESDVEEDFFKVGRKQAEERVERSVVKVQSMFRSKQAQQEYRRMKLAHNQARLEYEGFLNPEIDMGYLEG